MLLGPLLAVALSAAAPPFCAAPATEVDRMICADPELTALAKASLKLAAAVDAAEPGGAAERAELVGWPQSLHACRDAACIRQDYIDWLRALVDRYYESGVLIRIKGAQVFAVRNPPRLSNTLVLYDLGDGWRLFWLDAELAYGSRQDPTVHSGSDVGLVRIVDGRGLYRTTPVEGYDFERRGRDWFVRQVGDCPCGAHVTMEGVYRPTRKPFPVD
jgi:hypothetical protein